MNGDVRKFDEFKQHFNVVKAWIACGGIEAKMGGEALISLVGEQNEQAYILGGQR